MNQQQIETRKDRAEGESLVISLREEGGFRVFSPAHPTKIYTVVGDAEGVTCTCPDFQLHRADPEWQCNHIVAVKNLASGEEPVSGKSEEANERRAPTPQETSGNADIESPARLLIKRSVSPDGRIDSLSLEVSYPIDNDTPADIKEGTQKVLGILSDIIEEFKGENGRAPEQRSALQINGNSSVSAQMMSVGGMKGKWGGRRLFLNFDVNGQTVKLFGNRNELAQYIVYAGFPNLADRIAEGTILNLPCRVVTRPSADGKYVNIERVYPIEALRFTRTAAK
jgi:hypothetical protein